MKSIAPGAEDPDFHPLTARQARAWRSRNPPFAVWRLLAAQALLGALLALALWALTGDAALGWSVAYGALAVLLPAALLARAALRAVPAAAARAAGPGLLLGFWLGELAKIAATVALLAAAPGLLPGLSWPALLLGMVLVMKTYWVALWLRPGVRKTDD